MGKNSHYQMDACYSNNIFLTYNYIRHQNNFFSNNKDRRKTFWEFFLSVTLFFLACFFLSFLVCNVLTILYNNEIIGNVTNVLHL